MNLLMKRLLRGHFRSTDLKREKKDENEKSGLVMFETLWYHLSPQRAESMWYG